MDIFYNAVVPNYDMIVMMGPKWHTEYRELDANYRFAGWTLDLMAFFLEQLVHDEFPMFCTEEKLRLFEKMLRIQYMGGETLEERRNIVNMFFSGLVKMSKSTIQNAISQYASGKGDVKWEGDTLVIEVDSSDGTKIEMQILHSFINRIIPAHIQYEFRIYASVPVCVSHDVSMWRALFDMCATDLYNG